MPDIDAIVQDLENKDYPSAIAKVQELVALVPGQI